ncbi:MAG: response regulator [Deltaproteobacteria bacterium]|nr:response regulator [Deltaproteobacteria bacterium]
MVDDTPLLRELVALFLARAGRIFTAASGEEALALARVIHPDLVFADLSMPGVDGAELCRRLKGSPEHHDVPVVLLTGRDAAGERERAIRAGANDVIPKPVERLPLLAAARRLLDQRSPRGLPRIPVEAPVRLRQRRREWAGTARNLSRGGVFVESAELLAEHAELALELALPETPLALASTAQVIWTRAPDEDVAAGMGMRFLGLDRRTARRLSEYVEERLPAPLAFAGGEP